MYLCLCFCILMVSNVAIVLKNIKHLYKMLFASLTGIYIKLLNWSLFNHQIAIDICREYTVSKTKQVNFI